MAIKPYPSGRVAMSTVMPGLGTLVLFSRPAAAKSLFSDFEYRSFRSDVLPLIVMAIVAFVAVWQFRKRVRQQAASAPPDARRSPRERALHRASVFFIMAPMLYAILIQSDWLFPFFAMMVAQPVVLVALRPLGLPFGWRLACILPAGIVSIFVGELVESWPQVTLLPAANQAWVLIACAASFALGALLSYLSFPPGYRDRTWP